MKRPGCLLALAALVAVALWSWSELRHGYTALLAMSDMAGLATPLPDPRPGTTRSELSYADGEQGLPADLYLPRGESARAGLLLVPGAAPDGRRDARLVAFAASLARSGFAVMVPDIPSFRALRPAPASVGQIAAALATLGARAELAPDRRLGLGAFSMAVGPAVLALLEPAPGRAADFAILVGGYHDLGRTLAYLTTGFFEVDGQPRHNEPLALGKWAYALSNAQRLSDPRQRELMTRLAQRKLADPQAEVGDLVRQLDLEGRVLYGFITNDDPRRVPELIAGLPEEVRADLEGMDLAGRDLSGVEADVILVHGLDDVVIPYSESLALARALPPDRVSLHLVGGLHHVDQDVSGADAWRLWRAVQELMAQRD